jgi:hypothetical protein
MGRVRPPLRPGDAECLRRAGQDGKRPNGFVRYARLVHLRHTPLDLVDLNLALEFYPHRRRVLDIVQAFIADAHRERLTFTPNDFVLGTAVAASTITSHEQCARMAYFVSCSAALHLGA